LTPQPIHISRPISIAVVLFGDFSLHALGSVDSGLLASGYDVIQPCPTHPKFQNIRQRTLPVDNFRVAGDSPGILPGERLGDNFNNTDAQLPKLGTDMLRLRYFLMSFAVLTAVLGGPIPLAGQSVPEVNSSDSVAIHISLEKSSYAIGEKPIVVMTLENVSSTPVWFSNSPYEQRIHVTTQGGEAPETELHRHLRGDFRPGDGSDGLRGGSAVGRSIAPNSLTSQRYDLAAYYDFSKPGEYSVYLELYDPTGPKNGSGHWLRTNTVTFEMQARAH